MYLRSLERCGPAHMLIHTPHRENGIERTPSVLNKPIFPGNRVVEYARLTAAREARVATLKTARIVVFSLRASITSVHFCPFSQGTPPSTDAALPSPSNVDSASPRRGYRFGRELAEHYASADCFVFPSRN